jgi:UDP-glucose 4-epimerase
LTANTLVDALMTLGANFCVFDNLSSRTLQNIKQWLNNPKFTFIKGDLLKPTDLKKLEEEHFDLVFHLVANPGVRVGSTNPNIHFQQNLAATHNLLEHHRKTRNTPTLIFTSTVYGARLPKIQQEAPQQANASQTEQSHHHIHQSPAENHKH